MNERRLKGKKPTTKKPPFPGQPGLSQFERDMWRDVVIAAVGRGDVLTSEDAAAFACAIVQNYRRFEV